MDEILSDARRAHLGQLGLLVLKNAMLINAGACIALFTLVGHASTSQTSKISVAGFASPLVFFVTGALVSALAAGTEYLAAGFSALEKSSPTKFWGWATIGLVVVSFFLFVAGAWTTYNALVGTK